MTVRHQLKDYKKIRITREQRRSKNRSYTVHDESLRDRAYRLNEDFELPDLPPAMQSRVHYGETIEIPASGSNAWKLLGFVPGIVVMLLVVFVFLRPLLRNADMPAEIRFVVMAFLGGVFVVLPLLRMARSLAVALRPQRVIASPDRITLKTPGLFLSRNVSIPADELEDLSLPQRESTPDLETETAPEVARALARMAPHNPFAITARSDRQTIVFGEGMPEDELRWTYLMVKKMLTM